MQQQPHRRTTNAPLTAAFAIGLLGLLSCGDSNPEPVIAHAYVGPITLPAKDGLGVSAKVVGTLKHGEKVSIVATRRRFFRVRLKDKDAWVDGFQLMTQPEVDELKKLAESTKSLPSQGTASTHDAVNIHTEPTRHSPSFHQVPEKGEVEIIGHTITERVQGPAPEPPVMEMVKLASEPAPIAKKKKKPSTKVAPPPRAAAPPLPANWQDISKTILPVEEIDPELKTGKKSLADLRRAFMANIKKVTGVEDWSLIRLKDGRAGWVLTNLIYMAIPDDVAQYAEGSRITSYFKLKEVDDEGVKKNFWLWTTRTRSPVPYQYDSFRVFTWSLKRHRYETAYRENNIKGFYPVTVSKDGPLIHFTLITEEPGGAFVPGGQGPAITLDNSQPAPPPTTGSVFVKKTYEFDGRIVHLQSQVQTKSPIQPETSDKTPLSEVFAKQSPQQTPKKGVIDSVKERWQKLFN